MDYRDFLQQRRLLIAKVVRAAFDKLRGGQLPEEEALPFSTGFPEWSAEDLLAQMETEWVEFKSSAYFSYRPDIPEKVVTESVLKTIAGFLNSSGGTLAIGIADDGEPLGIQPDLDKKNMDEDRYIGSLTTAIGRSLGSLASTRAKIQLEDVNDIRVALVHVAPSPEPIYAKVSKGDNVFFARVNNSTRILGRPRSRRVCETTLGIGTVFSPSHTVACPRTYFFRTLPWPEILASWSLESASAGMLPRRSTYCSFSIYRNSYRLHPAGWACRSLGGSPARAPARGAGSVLHLADALIACTVHCSQSHSGNAQ